MTISVELQEEQAIRLDRFATGVHKSRSDATARLIEEGLRRIEFPAVEFRDSVVGRQAYLVGTRLAIWQVLMVAEDYELDAAATAKHLNHIDQDRISQALRYAVAFESEVRSALEENRAITAEKLRASLPPGTRFEVR